jgi:acylphosphatase
VAEAVIVFTGQFEPDAFAAFVRHRAARLDLTASILDSAPHRIRVAVSGGPEMIEAFEIACSLGPLSCQVRDVARGAA